jgi:stromal membrane-associated protein
MSAFATSTSVSLDESNAKAELLVLMQLAENSMCADCEAPSPTWVSVNNGVFICTQCSGIHRSLGVQYSFVQSAKLDEWTRDAVESLRTAGGTATVNETLLEYHVPESILKPSPDADRATREAYIRDKYVNQSFRPSRPPRRPLRRLGGGEKDQSKFIAVCFKSKNALLNLLCAGIGSIEFIGVLAVKLISARNLINADVIGRSNVRSMLLVTHHFLFAGLSDPYVVFSLGRQSVRSKVIDNNLNPVWNETLMLSWDGRSALLAEVFDKDLTSDDGTLGIDSPFSIQRNLFI